MNAALRGKKVLVLEDEFFLADDLRHDLEKTGAIVLGPFASLAETRRFLEGGTGRPDLAVLDVKLRDGAVYDVADTLTGWRVPFVFASGYDEARLPDRYQPVPKLLKPYDPDVLTTLLVGLLDGK